MLCIMKLSKKGEKNEHRLGAHFSGLFH